jgi:23S rRNA pseudouridine2605 synthase
MQKKNQKHTRKSAATKEKNEAKGIRLNKFIADSGYCSRRKADELIAEGVVKVNQKVITALGTLVTQDAFVTINGDPIKNAGRYVYILLNKPKDVITTTSDEKNRKTVMDIVHSRSRVFPVGRLDRNTTGVLLLTNDGELTNRLTHPSSKIERVYNVGLDKPLTETEALKISRGIELEDGKTAPCEIFINPSDKSKVTLVLFEGKNREVRRIFESLGYEVKKLDRKSFAGITASGLSRGEYRHLTKKEANALLKLVKLL